MQITFLLHSSLAPSQHWVFEPFLKQNTESFCLFLLSYPTLRPTQFVLPPTFVCFPITPPLPSVFLNWFFLFHCWRDHTISSSFFCLKYWKCFLTDLPVSSFTFCQPKLKVPIQMIFLKGKLFHVTFSQNPARTLAFEKAPHCVYSPWWRGLSLLLSHFSLLRSWHSGNVKVSECTLCPCHCSSLCLACPSSLCPKKFLFFLHRQLRSLSALTEPSRFHSSWKQRSFPSSGLLWLFLNP